MFSNDLESAAANSANRRIPAQRSVETTRHENVGNLEFSSSSFSLSVLQFVAKYRLG